MHVIDSHCHASPLWYEPVETLLHEMDRNEVQQAILVQLLGQFDNNYLLDCRTRYAQRLAAVVAVDPADTAAVTELRRLAGAGASGLRLRPEARSSGDDPYALWRTAASCALAVSCVGPAAGFLAPAFADLVRELPDLPIVLEHLGGLARPDCDRSEATRQAIGALARFPNLYLKVPGLGQLTAREPLLPAAGRVLPLEAGTVVLDLLERFGASRLMWGSDFPPVAAREGYRNALRWIEELLEGLDPAGRAEVFGGTARRLFRLP
jgi:L-fuconolactonase